MSDYFIMDCGHKTMRDPWGNRPDECCPGLCRNCKEDRIGEIINFVRYGNIPASGKSKNHRDNSIEDGVSVYEIKDGKEKLVGFHFDITDREKTYGVGEIVGWGSDCEPLVRVIKIIK